MSRPLETNSGTVTKWLPLTTIYPSNSGCAEHAYSVVANTVAFWDPGYGIKVDTDLHCQPSQLTDWWNNQPVTDRFSIGPIACPAAYTTVTTSVKDSTSTFVACCPSGFSLNRDMGVIDVGNTGQCTTILEPGFVLTYGVDSNLQWVVSTTTLQHATTAAGIQINGWIFAGDPPVQTPVQTAPSSTTSTFTTALVSPSPSNPRSGSIPSMSTAISSSSSSNPIPATTQSSTSNFQTGPSVATSAAIGVGAGLGTLLVLGSLIMLILHLRGRTFGRRREPLRYPVEMDGHQPRSELSSKRDYPVPLPVTAQDEPKTYQHVFVHRDPRSNHLNELDNNSKPLPCPTEREDLMSPL